MTPQEYNEIVFCLLCEFGSAVDSMLNKWKIGIFNSCEEYKLIELRMIITTLMNYDRRDLPNFTTEYNNLTKEDIFNLIDIFKVKIKC